MFFVTKVYVITPPTVADGTGAELLFTIVIAGATPNGVVVGPLGLPSGLVPVGVSVALPELELFFGFVAPAIGVPSDLLGIPSAPASSPALPAFTSACFYR